MKIKELSFFQQLAQMKIFKVVKKQCQNISINQLSELSNVFGVRRTIFSLIQK
jgi:hypothetical protein